MLKTTTSSNYSNNFCNNCGKYGHMFHQCKQPITSIGILAFRKGLNNNIEFLMIRRKNSLGFFDFMSGKYPLYNRNYLKNIIDEMTNEEKRLVVEYDFDQLWEHIWGKHTGIQYRCEEKISKEKCISLKFGINVNNQEYNLQSLVNESNTTWDEPEWGFPKGRRNYQEKDLQCAIREFEEETGYTKDQMNIIQNVLPYEEIFTGSNYKSYKHKYYLANMNDTVYITDTDNSQEDYQNSEISKMKWCSFEEACNLIRPYNLEKIKILELVNTILTQYRLYS
jgi:8-oxo-dGTP pyrophosphatase MutT (NUDIX family)